MDAMPENVPESGQHHTLGVEIPVAVPPIRVWKALLEPDDMKHWFCERAEVERRPGGRLVFDGRYVFRSGAREIAPATVLGFETGRSVSFAWVQGGQPTRVRFLLSAIRGDCRLRVLQDRVGPPNRDWRGEVADHVPWENYLLNLKMYLERGDAGVRVDYDRIPSGRQSIRGELRCASERIWRVLTDREEFSRLAGGGEIAVEPGQGWTEPFGPVKVVAATSGRHLVQRWQDDQGASSVSIEWDLVSRGVTSTLMLSTSGEGAAESWHEGDAGLWTHLTWCRAFNKLKYYCETGQLTGLRRLAGDL